MDNEDMSDKSRDRAIGMNKPIDRRDFLQGAAMTVAAAAGGMVPELVLGAEFETARAAQDQPGYYPPTRTGMRGSHPGSYESAHAVRDNPNFVTDAEDTGELSLLNIRLR